MPAGGGSRPRELFLSHASQDRAVADAVSRTLVGHGVPVWYSTTSIGGAQQWHDRIGAALNRCDWFMVLLTPNSAKSIWVKRELVYALNDRRYEERIVPVLARDCDWRSFSWTLGSIQFIDLRLGFHDGCRSILATWGIGLDPDLCVPPIPPRRTLRLRRKA